MGNYNAKAYTEVLEILKFIPREEFEKIPKEEIEFYKENCDKNYKFVINENIPLEEQDISRRANAILITIYMEYFLTEEKRKIVKDILKLNRIKEEKEKSQNYHGKTNLNNKEKITINSSNASNDSILKIENLTIWEKIKRFFRKILNK